MRALASSVRGVVPVTGNFQSEAALNSRAQEAMLSAIESGWADPKKIGQYPSRAALLRNGAIESLAHHLGLSPDQIEVTGEVGLSYFLALAGLLDETKYLYSGAGDRSGVIAIVRSHKGPTFEIPLSKDGTVNFSTTVFAPNSVLAFQLANGESGAINDLPNEIPKDLLIAVDATASGARVKLPKRWDSACFDSRSWDGPAGLAIVAINNPAKWKNPLPHISSVRRTYGTYSLPLLLASAVALENYRPSEVSTRELTERFRTDISKALPDALIAGELEKSMAHLTSLVIPGTNGEELLRELDRKGFAVDSGSACTAMNLQPSHVLSAMGLPTDGNIRIAVHTETTLEEITGLVNALVGAVRSQQQR
jgi:cysteine desulfurase